MSGPVSELGNLLTDVASNIRSFHGIDGPADGGLPSASGSILAATFSVGFRAARGFWAMSRPAPISTSWRAVPAGRAPTIEAAAGGNCRRRRATLLSCELARPRSRES